MRDEFLTAISQMTKNHLENIDGQLMVILQRGVDQDFQEGVDGLAEIIVYIVQLDRDGLILDIKLGIFFFLLTFFDLESLKVALILQNHLFFFLNGYLCVSATILTTEKKVSFGPYCPSPLSRYRTRAVLAHFGALNVWWSFCSNFSNS